MTTRKRSTLPSEDHGHSGRPDRPVQSLEPTTRKRTAPVPPRYEHAPTVTAPYPDTPPAPTPVPESRDYMVVLGVGDLIYREKTGWFKVTRVTECSATLAAQFTQTKVIKDHLHGTQTEVYTSGNGMTICPRPYVFPGQYIKAGKVRRRTT